MGERIDIDTPPLSLQGYVFSGTWRSAQSVEARINTIGAFQDAKENYVTQQNVNSQNMY